MRPLLVLYETVVDQSNILKCQYSKKSRINYSLDFTHSEVNMDLNPYKKVLKIEIFNRAKV